MYNLEYLLIPFLVSVVCRAPYLNHGQVATRRQEHVVHVDGVLP
jgi:hypothetical protein